MVTQTETTKIVTTPKLQDHVEPSLKRWLKHFLYLPMTKRYFTQQDQNTISSAVSLAEQGHVGEIQVVIEGHIPCSTAYRMDSRLRAEQLFAELGVWDTEFNSGVLLYLNLCDQSVEIVIDRGLKKLTSQQSWDELCTQMIAQLKNKHYCQAVCEVVAEIGNIFKAFDQHPSIQHLNSQHPDIQNQNHQNNNELPDRPLIID